MRPNQDFVGLDKSFWACVRTISQAVGYTVRGRGLIRVPTIDEMVGAFENLSLDPLTLANDRGEATPLGQKLHDYFHYRAEILNNHVEPRLMDADRAQSEFDKLYATRRPGAQSPLPMNKQKGEKKAHAFLTCIINMLIEEASNGQPCDYDPRVLTTITKNGAPLRTLARRVDGAFPSAINPVAVWEIKEYYYTITFGSRVADGVYETLLDGMELEELQEHEGVDVKHYLMVDAHYTWWDCGRSYLCRMVDMVHLGYVDEILFGYEAIEEMPRIVSEWVKALEAREAIREA